MRRLVKTGPGLPRRHERSLASRTPRAEAAPGDPAVDTAERRTPPKRPAVPTGAGEAFHQSSTSVALQRSARSRGLRRTRPITSAFGSSTPALRMPRGRWYFQLRATSLTPLASRADASVSPAKPVYCLPLKEKRTGFAAIDSSAGRAAHGNRSRAVSPDSLARPRAAASPIFQTRDQTGSSPCRAGR